MKNLVIRSGSLRMGGLERVLIDTLNLLDTSKYKVSLIIEDDCEEQNIFQNDVPKDIQIYFIKPKSVIDKTHKYRENRKKSFISRVLYNWNMHLEHRLCYENTKKILSLIEEKNGEIDLFIDYDWGATRYIDKLNLKNKIVWIHNSVSNLMKKKSKIERFGKRLKKYDCVVSICDEMKEEIEEIYPFLKRKVKRVYNPFDFEKIERMSKDKEKLSLEEQGLLKDSYILAVSRLDTVQKDYQTLLKGFKKALDNGFSKKLYILGDGPNSDEIKKISKDFNLENKVVFLGRKKNPYIWMKNCEFFVHSSKYEGFGLVIVEAMSLKKATIVSDCKVGPKEILGNGKYGVLFEVGDYLELSKSILDLDKDLNKREQLEEIGYKKSLDFSGEIIKKEIEKLINSIVEGENDFK